MDKLSRQDAAAKLERLINITQIALDSPQVPSTWKLAAGALVQGGREALAILQAGDAYGNAFFFGTTDGPHQLYGVDLEPVPLFPRQNLTDIPESIAQGIDGGFLPDTDTEGVARVQVIEGWTVIAFNDRSADRRMGSHSTFVIAGTHPAEEGILKATELFPTVFQRYPFSVVSET